MRLTNWFAGDAKFEINGGDDDGGRGAQVAFAGALKLEGNLFTGSERLGGGGGERCGESEGNEGEGDAVV